MISCSQAFPIPVLAFLQPGSWLFPCCCLLFLSFPSADVVVLNYPTSIIEQPSPISSHACPSLLAFLPL